MRWRAICLTITLLALAIVSVSCGGSSSSTSSDSSDEPSKEFAAAKELAGFGREADDTEREAASDVLEDYFQARSAKDWDGQCASISAGLIRSVEKAGSPLGASGCAEGIEALAGPAPPSAFTNTMTGPIDALRVGGKRGFALYHGTKGKDYVMPMAREGDEWKVAALSTQEIR